MTKKYLIFQRLHSHGRPLSLSSRWNFFHCGLNLLLSSIIFSLSSSVSLKRWLRVPQLIYIQVWPSSLPSHCVPNRPYRTLDQLVSRPHPWCHPHPIQGFRWPAYSVPCCIRGLGRHLLLEHPLLFPPPKQGCSGKKRCTASSAAGNLLQ